MMLLIVLVPLQVTGVSSSVVVKERIFQYGSNPAYFICGLWYIIAVFHCFRLLAARYLSSAAQTDADLQKASISVHLRARIARQTLLQKSQSRAYLQSASAEHM